MAVVLIVVAALTDKEESGLPEPTIPSNTALPVIVSAKAPLTVLPKVIVVPVRVGLAVRVTAPV